MHVEMRNIFRISAVPVLAAALMALAACQPGSTIETTPVQSQQGTELSVTPALSPGTGSGGQDGLSYEEMRSTTPPAPIDLRVSAVAEGMRLDWKPAPAVEIAHSYSEVVLHYNIYRHVEGDTVAHLLTTVSGFQYVDKSVERGMVYYYAVSAVHEGPVEGERTDELSGSLP